MITEIYVKNFALIEELRLSLGSGMSVVTGETGAGKSIFVEALSLLSGGRAQPGLIRTGCKEAIIEAVVDVADLKEIRLFLNEHGFEENHLIIRRHLTTEGRNRIYVNGVSATLNQLNQLGELLFDLTSQHEQQVLLRDENHRAILDHAAFRSLQLLSDYQKTWNEWQELSQELSRRKESQLKQELELDFLKFQVDEIQKAKLDHDHEEENLLHERARVRNADSLFEMAQSAVDLINLKDQSLLETLDTIHSKVSKNTPLDESLNEGLSPLVTAKESLLEALYFFEKYLEQIRVDPGRLEEIESRLYLIHQLKKKYGATIADIRQRGEEFQNHLTELENLDGLIEELTQKIESKSFELVKMAQKISLERHQRAIKLEKQVKKELEELSMPQVTFKIRVDSPLKPTASDCGLYGFDHVCFELSANPGEALQPLSLIASGGELSRILLAIKSILRQEGTSATYVFDEVDTGIGGAIASVVGLKLKKMATRDQVLVVTHLPQIASFADAHFRIEKKVESGRTRTEICFLDKSSAREEEIARMLGGVAITSKTRAHAREMLQETRGR